MSTEPHCGEHPHLTWPIAMQCMRDRQDAEIARLQAAKRAALAIADERSKENVALRAEIERLRAREEMVIREAIDQAWGEALEDGSVPPTELQNKIVERVRMSAGHEQSPQEARNEDPSRSK